MKTICESKRKMIKSVIFGLVFAVFVECFLVNYRTWESFSFSPIEGYLVDYGSGKESREPGKVHFSKEEAVIEITGINEVVHNLYLDIQPEKKSIRQLSIRISAVDDGNELYYQLPELVISANKGNYVKLNLSGKAKKLKIEIEDLKGESVWIKQTGLNAHKPFYVDVSHIAGIFVLWMLVCGIFHMRHLFKNKCNLKDKKQYVICMAVIGIELAAVLSSSFSTAKYVNPPWVHHYQYEKLAQSLAKGHFYLDIEPSRELQAMDNPYDKNLRKELNVSHEWDTAYYQGKYYVYFGIMPVLVFYLPFYLITGHGFPTIAGTVICEVFLILGILLLLLALVKRYFRKTTLGIFLMLDILLFCASGILIIAVYPTFYALPIIMGLCFVVWGWYFLLSGLGPDRVRLKRVFAGCICLALTAGCRPQMLAACFPGLCILIPYLKKIWKLDQRTCIKYAGICLVPFIVIGFGLMYYNFARFGSPFDFGANYNLTTNDMTNRGFHPDRFPLGIYMFLFQPVNFQAQFPFIQKTDVVTAYQGITIFEGMYGGILMLHPFLWMNLLLFKVRKGLKRKGLLLFAGVSLGAGMIIMCADVQIAGILMRYMCDFGIFLSIPALLVILEAVNEIRDKQFLAFISAGTAVLTGISVLLGALYLCK
ncbi:hypothetical protein [uncultured Robinsoniella sp.]|uniref:hypothetical protein n=1 Tax=uncultured Robinsoniella sp. TaxID=904190 RepID=UPI00374FBE18